MRLVSRYSYVSVTLRAPSCVPIHARLRSNTWPLVPCPASGIRSPTCPSRLELPDLIAVQRESFEWFLNEGLAETFRDISPIKDFSEALQLELEFDPDDEDLRPPPKFTVDECKEKDMTYSAPIFVRARFMNRNTGEIKEQTVFMGDFPMMTEKGTFIINGTERVVVSQLVRCPGVIFEPGERFRLRNLSKHQLVKGTIHPYRGEWLEFDVEQKPGKDVTAGTRVARKRRMGVFTLLRALGYDEEHAPGFIERFVAHFDFLEGQWEKERHIAPTQNEALVEIYKRARPGEPPTVESAKAYFRNAFFENRRYDLSPRRPLQARPQAGHRSRQARRAVRQGHHRARLVLHHRPGRPEPQARIFSDPDDDHVLRPNEVLAVISYMLHLVKQEPGYRLDDQDHFANRRIRSVGELIQNQVRIGLSRMERVVRERMTTQDVEAITPDHPGQHPPGGRRHQGVLRHLASCRSSWTRSTRCRASPTVVACRPSGRAASAVSVPASKSATCTSATTAVCARSRRRKARTSA